MLHWPCSPEPGQQLASRGGQHGGDRRLGSQQRALAEDGAWPEGVDLDAVLLDVDGARADDVECVALVEVGPCTEQQQSGGGGVV